MKSERDWLHVDYSPGSDEFWDRLGGDSWGAIDGLAPGIRVYATWAEQASGRMVVTSICVKGSPGSPVTADALRAIPVGRLEAAANEVSAGIAEAMLRKAPRLYRPDGRHPEEFYSAVATHYRWHAALSRRPAARMAEAAGVPVTTVHRWIREARARGFLPKGRQGSVG